MRMCTLCGQTDHGQTGEYPCPKCGLPITHDPPPPCPTCGGTGMLDKMMPMTWGSSGDIEEVSCYECCPQDDEPILREDE